MPLYTKDSLERVRQRIDLVEVLSSHMDLKKAGASYKGLCPFHDEKTPSFVVQKGDTHYHCFGCGAHGDAISFLMTYLKLSFSEALETLAERFHVTLEIADAPEEKGPNKTLLKEVLEIASQFYHYYLLYTEEGREALYYLLKRGLKMDFIRRFEIGLAPKIKGLLRSALQAKRMASSLLHEAGLLSDKQQEFFRDRITFPIRNSAGSIIGFSARKYHEETTGGKYINSPETVLFKKSRVLFGLNYCRRRITMEKRAIIVEGQIDCLRMIEAGFDLTVASLGTAFGSAHVKELAQLGVREVYLLFDGDTAGQTAASKVGDLFQKEGMGVYVALLPQGADPDTFLAKEGKEKLKSLLQEGLEYLPFQLRFLSKEINANTPSGKTELIHALKKQIQAWEDPVLVYESLKKLAELTSIPEEMLNLSGGSLSYHYVKKVSSSITDVDPNRILELDLLRWLLLLGKEKERFVEVAKTHLQSEHFWVPLCRKLFESYLKAYEEKGATDLISLFIDIHDEHLHALIDEMMKKKINTEKAEGLFIETVQKILDRQWMQTREEIKNKIHSGQHSETEILELAKAFDQLKQQRPKVTL